jgi:hypothetical protein
MLAVHFSLFTSGSFSHEVDRTFSFIVELLNFTTLCQRVGVFTSDELLKFVCFLGLGKFSFKLFILLHF